MKDRQEAALAAAGAVPAPEPPQPSSPSVGPDPYRTAVVAAERLREALARHRLAFPSLRGSFPTPADGPIVEAGGVAADVVERLAELLEGVEPRQADR
ncbi:hypothetical protein [Kitasatospora sp. NPDC057936]|uniref:hypothetical protein n=1 Tax=Kitasatospora sp. NPDC057936 TaxID=3346283 RepID=UPI0036DCD234